MSRMVAIGDCVEPCQTWNPSAAAPAETFRYIDLSSVDRKLKRIIRAEAIFCSNAPSRARQLVKAGDVLVSTVRPNLNGAAIVPMELDGATASTGFTVLRAREGQIDRSYLFHWVKHPRFVDDMVRKATGANYPAVSDRIVRESLIPLSTLPEQRRIAAILDKADELRAKRREAIARLNQLLKSVFFDMFGDPFENPLGWPTCELGELLDGGPQNGIYKPSQDYGSGTPILRIDGFRAGDTVRALPKKRVRLTDSEVLKYGLSPLDIVINRVNSPEHLGKPALLQDLDEPTVFESNMMRISVNPKALSPEYMITYLTQAFVRSQIAAKRKDAINQSSINQDDVKSLKVRLPPLKLQERFRSVRDQIIKQREVTSLGEISFDSLFATLQHRAFSGTL